MILIKSGKQLINEVMELPNKYKIKTLAENETYKYLGILEADTIKQVEMKDKIQKNIPGKLKELLDTKLSCRNHSFKNNATNKLLT